MTSAVNRGGTSPLPTIKISLKSFNAELVVTGQVGVAAAVASGAAGLGPPPSPLLNIHRGRGPLPPALPPSLPTTHLPVCSSSSASFFTYCSSPPCVSGGELTAERLPLTAVRSMVMAFRGGSSKSGRPRRNAPAAPAAPSPVATLRGTLRASPLPRTAPPELSSSG